VERTLGVVVVMRIPPANLADCITASRHQYLYGLQARVHVLYPPKLVSILPHSAYLYCETPRLGNKQQPDQLSLNLEQSAIQPTLPRNRGHVLGVNASRDFIRTRHLDLACALILVSNTFLPFVETYKRISPISQYRSKR
jgi:hypothetical protein